MQKPLFKLSTLALALATTFTAPVFAGGFTNTTGGFTNNGDGTVTDTKSGLVWQACAVGQTFNASTGNCDGAAKTYTYTDALALTSNFGGQTDWRVPTISELQSLVDLKKTNPSINKSLFPNPPANWFWSSSPNASNGSNAWFVDFGYGYSNYDYFKGYDSSVRLVRGSGDSVFSLLSLKDFVDNEDGTVTHTKTGLTWQRCAVGQTWSDGYCDGKAATYKQEDAAKLTSDMSGQSDWHLPSLRELQTIVDYSTSQPATNLIIFPNAPSNKFWTTTPKAETTDNFWYVGFDYGQSSYTSKTTAYSARLVRGSLNSSGATTTPAQTPTISTPVTTGSVDLSSTLSANPSPAQIGGDLTYSATITNKGTATATGTQATFFLAPRFMTFKNSSENCEETGLSVVCQIGNLAAGANVTKTMTVTLKKAGGISSSVSAKANEKDANPVDNIGKVTTGVKK